MKTVIAVCDDMELHLNNTYNKLTEYLTENFLSVCADKNGEPADLNDFFEIVKYSKAQNLLDDVKQNKHNFNIILLDIEMTEEDISGITLANEVNSALPECQIIFITGYLDYAMDVYSTKHIYLVLKTKIDDGLPDALKKAFLKLEDIKKKTVCLNTNNGKVVIKLNDIIYFERMHRKTKVKTTGGEMFTASPLDELLHLINQPDFIRCHNSFAVNADHINVYKNNCLHMSNGEEITISRTYQKTFSEQFLFLIAQANVIPNKI